MAPVASSRSCAASAVTARRSPATRRGSASGRYWERKVDPLSLRERVRVRVRAGGETMPSPSGRGRHPHPALSQRERVLTRPLASFLPLALIARQLIGDMEPRKLACRVNVIARGDGFGEIERRQVQLHFRRCLGAAETELRAAFRAEDAERLRRRSIFL